MEVTAEERPRVVEMLQRYLSLWDGHLLNVKNVQHRIPFTGPPKRQTPYRRGLKTRDAVQEEI
jgi:hypothetical protein